MGSKGDDTWGKIIDTFILCLPSAFFVYVFLVEVSNNGNLAIIALSSVFTTVLMIGLVARLTFVGKIKTLFFSSEVSLEDVLSSLGEFSWKELEKIPSGVLLSKTCEFGTAKFLKIILQNNSIHYVAWRDGGFILNKYPLYWGKEIPSIIRTKKC